MIITVIILFIITMILKPQFHYFFGFLLAIFVGLMIDLFSKVIPPVAGNLLFQILYFIFSLLSIAFGVALIIRSKLPMNAMDNLMMIIVNKTRKPVALIKILLETLYTLIALVLGFLSGIGFGAISIGTIVMTLVVGPLINGFLKVIKPIK